MTKFRNDLQEGVKVEQEVLDLLQKRNPNADIMFNTGTTLAELREYDLKMVKNNQEIKFEVKWDRLAPKTNNVALEFRCVEHSKAEVFIYKIAEDFLAIQTNKLITLMNTKIGRLVYGGDRDASFMKLIPLDVFKKLSIKIN